MGEKINIARQDTLEEVLNILEADSVYGFIEHNATLAPGSRIEYIGKNKNYTPLTVTMGGGYSLGGWADFPWLKANKPYMVRSDGTADYRLKEDDYTKKEDGSESDVSNEAYDGGAFAWCKKIYKNEYMAGDDRYVLFRFSPAPGFEPVGFIDSDNNELEGIWIPMFYGTIIETKAKCIAGNQPAYNNNVTTEKAAVDAFGARARFLGGAIVNTLVDLMIMFARNTNLQSVYGTGNMNGYDTSLAPTNGVKENAVVGGGQFYGTNTNKALNKIFHSIVLGSYQQYMRDPYTMLINNALKVSTNYTYDATGSSYLDTQIRYNTLADWNWHYPHKYRVIKGFGAVPDTPCKGSTTTGGCDGLYKAGGTNVALRFGNCSDGANDGPRALNLNNPGSSAYWAFGFAVILLPPVGVAV